MLKVKYLISTINVIGIKREIPVNIKSFTEKVELNDASQIMARTQMAYEKGIIGNSNTINLNFYTYFHYSIFLFLSYLTQQ